MSNKIWKKTSFWAKVVISFNLIATTIQGSLLASDSAHVWNYVLLVIQFIGNLIALWTEDKNKNDVPDILEDEVVVTSTTTTVIKKDEPVKSDTETTIETKPN